MKPQAEKIIAEEEAGFRAGRSTTVQIFNPISSVRNIYSTSKTSTMSKATSAVLFNSSKAPTTYGKEISAEKAKLMTNTTSGINTEIKVNGQKLETVTGFK